MSKRLLLLTTTTGYQTRAFVEAARKLGAEVVFGSDRCHVLDDPWQDGALALHFEDAAGSAQIVADAARDTPFDAIVSLGDRPTATAAHSARALAIPFHPPEAAELCRDKYLSRARLKTSGMLVPDFHRFSLDSEAEEAARTVAGQIAFPCVLKPRALSGSRGVIRADNLTEFAAAFERLRALLESPEIRVMRDTANDDILVESYVEGTEIAVEGLVDRGRLRVLAIFDKPDPLAGPIFEEAIYVTPSRLPAARQSAAIQTLDKAARALGLHHGPVHAEFRLNSRGVWMLEVAARPIGGLCSRALRFCAPARSAQDGWMSLEELLIRLALGENVEQVRREAGAAGVMMIPVPEGGILQGVHGTERAAQIPGVEEILITAKPDQKLVPLPEGCSYPGFIIGRGPTPEFVEQALRQAHRELRFIVTPALPVV
ncbi:MAG: carboxylate--amine ligase [Acidobacteria bacterium]|nr:MAG: carboxylate--amine ligase [Acidobacteriota bacterium]